MNDKDWPTGMTTAEANVFDRAAIKLMRQVLPLLTGQTVPVVTSVVVAILARVASTAPDPDAFCLTAAEEAIVIVHDADGPIYKLN